MKGFFKSSIGKKLVMSISGLFLILFLLFHMCMNVVAVISQDGYNLVCEALGTNWYALAGTAVLALGFIIHIVWASVLTIQNRKARGNDRYDNQNLPAGVEWSSKNMYVLGIIVVAGFILHLVNFWAKMMFAELTGCEGGMFSPTSGYEWVHYWFSNPVVVILYLVWFAAIWFHLNHGFWSAFQTIGWSNKKWIPRLQCIAKWFTSIVMGIFALVVIIAFIQGPVAA